MFISLFALENNICKLTITLALYSQRQGRLLRVFDSIGELKIALYWVKDVIFGEDTAPFTNCDAATTGVY